MTVFVVTVGYENILCGVYSSRELAEQAISRDLPQWVAKRGRYDGPSIEEIKIDTPARFVAF